MKTQNDVRVWLEKKIKGPVNAITWANLVTEEYVKEVTDGNEDVSFLLQRYRTLEKFALDHERDHQPDQPPTSYEHDIPPDRRQGLISHILANEAAGEPRVREYRRKYLPTELLSRSGISAWINDLQEGIHAGDEVLLLYYVDAENKIKSEQVKSHAAYELVKLGEYLKRYTWQPELAATFVLTGEIPYIPIVNTRIAIASTLLPSRLGYSRSTVTLNIDLATPPAKVAEVYRQLRSEYRPGRNRPLSESVVQLVEFVLLQPEGKWSDKMTRWNFAHPKKRYDSPTQFGRDYNRAIAKLLRG